MTPDGLTLPAFGIGTAGFGRRHGARSAVAAMEAALDHGATHIDTAPMYGLGQAEAIVGRFLRGRREAVTVATKAGILPPPGAAGRVLPGRLLRGRLGPRPDYSPATLRAGFERSLRSLGTGYVDVLLLHEIPASEVTDDVIAFLDECVAAGTARAVGTATTPAATAAIAAARASFPSVVQVPWAPGGNEAPALPAATTIKHSVVGRALQAVRSQSDRPAGARRWSERLGVDCADANVVAALALALARRRDPSATILFASRRAERVTSNLALAHTYLGVPGLLDDFAALLADPGASAP